MSILSLALPALVAAGLTLLLTPLTRRLAFAVGAIDHPAPRKVHSAPIPRLGGLAVAAAVAVVLGAVAVFGSPVAGSIAEETSFAFALALSVLPVFAISLFDDIRPLRPLVKLLVHVAGATLAVWLGIRLPDAVHLFGTSIEVGVLAIPISILWIVGVTNAFNLVDGLDGLSAGLALISALSLAGVAAFVGLWGLASASFVLAGALIGFLPYNIYPAKVFLGDAGANTIGFCLACLALKSGSVMTAGMAVLLPIVVMGLPVAEGMISMLRRSLRRLADADRGIFEADRQHIHHRLLDLGLDHRRAVLTLYGIGVVLAACGFASMFVTNRGAAILLFTMLIAAFIGVKRLGYDEFALLRRGVVLKAFDAPVLKAALFTVFVDLAMVGVAVYTALGLKYDDWSLESRMPLAQYCLTVLPPVTLLVFWAMHLYRRSWRHAGLEDLLQSSWAVVVATSIGWVAATLILSQAPPISLFVIYAVLLMTMVNGARASYHMLFYLSAKASTEGEPVLIYSAGRSGAMALRELISNGKLELRPVGFLDDDPKKVGHHVGSYPIHGGVEALEALLEEGTVRGILVASNKVRPERVLAAKRLADKHGVWIRTFRIELRPIIHTAPVVEPAAEIEMPEPRLAAVGEPSYGLDVPARP
jgi:UDP-GlcNAc:undecaprenyl-phosphate/decaprenyl-phosphate GlcNAc-1-phosphate transferase